MKKQTNEGVIQLTADAVLNLLTTNYCVVGVTFRNQIGGGNKTYHYKCPLEYGVQVDDEVIVDSPSQGMVVVDVVEVKPYTEIDLAASFRYKWIVQKIDTSIYKDRVRMEEEARDLLARARREAERLKALRELRSSFEMDSELLTQFNAVISRLSGSQTVSAVSAVSTPETPLTPGS